jgi:hypothetical protein
MPNDDVMQNLALPILSIHTLQCSSNDVGIEGGDEAPYILQMGVQHERRSIAENIEE